MRELVINKTVFEFIENEIKQFNERTLNTYDMDFEEVLYSYIESTDDIHYVLNDWDEGKSNDPFWDDEKDMHCCYSFLEYMNDKLKNL